MQSTFYTSIWVLLITGLCLASCNNSPNFDDAPVIGFISISKDTMVQNQSNTDSLFLTISFKDGDGDLGTNGSSLNENIFLVDSRTDIIYDRFKIPEIPISGIQNGIEGTITMKVFTTCCRFDDIAILCPNPVDRPTNDFFIEIYMIDDAGNESNRINTNNITLLCN